MYTYLPMMKKPGIQAIANTTEDLLLPDENHKTVSRDYEYKRLKLFYRFSAGIDLQTGGGNSACKDKHSSKEYIEFLKILGFKISET